MAETTAVAGENLMRAFEVQVSEHSDCVVLAPSGEIDLDVASEFADRGSEWIMTRGVYSLVVDLSDVTFMDSTGLSALVLMNNAALGLGKRLSLRRVPQKVQRLL